MAGEHLKVGADVCALLLEAGGVGEEVDACAEVELSRKGSAQVETNASQSCLHSEAQLREGTKVPRFGRGGWRDGYSGSGLIDRDCEVCSICRCGVADWSRAEEALRAGSAGKRKDRKNQNAW